MNQDSCLFRNKVQITNCIWTLLEKRGGISITAGCYYSNASLKLYTHHLILDLTNFPFSSMILIMLRDRITFFDSKIVNVRLDANKLASFLPVRKIDAIIYGIVIQDKWQSSPVNQIYRQLGTIKFIMKFITKQVKIIPSFRPADKIDLETRIQLMPRCNRPLILTYIIILLYIVEKVSQLSNEIVEEAR